MTWWRWLVQSVAEGVEELPEPALRGLDLPPALREWDRLYTVQLTARRRVEAGALYAALRSIERATQDALQPRHGGLLTLAVAEVPPEGRGQLEGWRLAELGPRHPLVDFFPPLRGPLGDAATLELAVHVLVACVRYGRLAEGRGRPQEFRAALLKFRPALWLKEASAYFGAAQAMDPQSAWSGSIKVAASKVASAARSDEAPLAMDALAVTLAVAALSHPSQAGRAKATRELEALAHRAAAPVGSSMLALEALLGELRRLLQGVPGSSARDAKTVFVDLADAARAAGSVSKYVDPGVDWSSLMEPEPGRADRLRLSEIAGRLVSQVRQRQGRDAGLISAAELLARVQESPPSASDGAPWSAVAAVRRGLGGSA